MASLTIFSAPHGLEVLYAIWGFGQLASESRSGSSNVNLRSTIALGNKDSMRARQFVLLIVN